MFKNWPTSTFGKHATRRSSDRKDVKKVRDSIKGLWHSSEPTMSRMFVDTLSPIPLGLACGGDTLWNSHALPRNPNSPYSISAPKTDRHIGFPVVGSPNSLSSTWDINELLVADHPAMTPYSQPTSDNIFPSYLQEIKSEAGGDTLYAAEGQLASAGAHRINSWMWVLDQLDPDREQSSSDAVVFSDASTQRGAVAYVHYFDPENGVFCMSCIDQFNFRTDVQRYRDHIKNVLDWVLNTQQLVIRGVLQNLEPASKTWKIGRSASVATDQERSDLLD